MRLSDFDFELPEAAIALRPARPRDSARLLQVCPGDVPGAASELSDHVVRDLPQLLQPGDVLVFNDTRTIPARLAGVRPSRGRGGAGEAGVLLEINLHKREAPDAWRAFVRPAKRLLVCWQPQAERQSLALPHVCAFHPEVRHQVLHKGRGLDVFTEGPHPR